MAAIGIGCSLGSVSFGESAAIPGDEGASAGLEEIVVTAQRRQESLERAAIPVTAMTGDLLAKAGVSDVQALTNMIPAVQIATGSGPYNLFYLRGVGSFNVNPLSDAAVSLNLDGVPISRPSSTSGLFYDLERVEVLKGPQGTLYGRNATGGAINVVTRAPTLGEAEGDLTADFGNFDSRKFSGALNLPIGEKAALRAAFSTSDHEGYLSDGTDDDKGAAGRVRVLVEATSDLTLNLGADYYHQGGRGGGAVLAQDDFPKNRIGNTDPRSQAVYESTLYFPAGSFMPPLPEFAHANDNYWGVNGSLDWKTLAGTLTVTPAFRHSAIDYDSPESGLYVIETTVSKQSSVEARFASNNDQPLRWIAGTYYLDESDRTALDYNSQYNLSHQRLDLPLKSEAAFARLTYAIVESFRLTGGARYTRDRKSIDGDGSSSNILCRSRRIDRSRWSANPLRNHRGHRAVDAGRCSPQPDFH
jgi:iron complex outermembrane receptor protein